MPRIQCPRDHTKREMVTRIVRWMIHVSFTGPDDSGWVSQDTGLNSSPVAGCVPERNAIYTLRSNYRWGKRLRETARNFTSVPRPFNRVFGFNDTWNSVRRLRWFSTSRHDELPYQRTKKSLRENRYRSRYNIVFLSSPSLSNQRVVGGRSLSTWRNLARRLGASSGYRMKNLWQLPSFRSNFLLSVANRL